MKTYRYKPLVAAAALLAAAAVSLPLRAQDFPTQILNNSPIDYWRLTETSASPPIDVVSNHGSLGSAGNGYLIHAIRGTSGGVVGNYVAFTNTGQEIADEYCHIDIPNQPALNPNPPFTVEFWAKVNTPFSPQGDGSPPTGVCALASLSPMGLTGGYDNRSGYVFYATTGQWEMRVGSAQGYVASAFWHGPINGAWQHVVGTFDGTTINLYVNGVQNTFTNTPGANLASSPMTPNAFVPTRIGATDLTGGEYTDANGNDLYPDGNRGWDGGIDEVAIYNTILSTNTILAHYNMALTNPAAYDSLILSNAPVGYWNFDEPAYTPPAPAQLTIATDSGSLGDTATNTAGTVSAVPGVPGLSAGDAAVAYNGTLGSTELSTNLPAQYFGVPGSPGPGQGSPITMLAWIKPNSLQYLENILSQGLDLGTYAENFLRIGDTYDWESFNANDSYGDWNPLVVPNQIFYSVGTYDGSDPFYNTAVYPVPPGDVGNWVFLAGTYDGANWNLYRNGILVDSFPDADPYAVGTGPSGLTEPWSVGSCSDPSPYFGMFFDGAIEEAALFTNALSAVTISNLYQSVHRPPVITQAPVAPSPVYLGSAADFNVWADGPGTLTYQWYINNALQSGATETNFTVNDLTAGNDGTYSVVVSNAYGSVTSSVVLFVTPTLPPVTLTPASETRWTGFPLSFAPVSLPNQSLSFQWYHNSGVLPGATDSTYTAPSSAGSVGTYTLVISNSLGTATSSPSIFTGVLSFPPGYAATILTDAPIAFWRLDETNGDTAYDYAGGNNGTYLNTLLGHAGPPLLNPDPGATFEGAVGSYMGETGQTNIDFSGPNAQFSIEAWANGGAGQINGAAVVVKGAGNNGSSSSEQFAIAVDGSIYRFYTTDSRNALYEADASTGPDGTWQYLVGTYGPGSNLTLYINGQVAGTGTGPGIGPRPSTQPIAVGAERSGPTPVYDWDYSGTIGQVAIYNYALTSDQVSNHYAAAFGLSTPPKITLQPVSVTNYVGLPVSFEAEAQGTIPLSFQWNKVGSGPIAGATANVYTIPSLATTDAGTYTLGITNVINGTNAGVLSVPVTITVLQPPTTPLEIPGLVAHLTFDDTLVDATGRGNNGTNEASGGAPLLTNDYESGVIGDAFTYQLTISGTDTNANYASLGVRPDLQFGANDFTVSMWVQLPVNYVGNDIPFFCDVVGSTFGYPGYCFEPTFGQTVGSTLGWPGGWGFSVYSTTDAGTGVYGDVGTINDGFWHNLVYSVSQTSGTVVYLDGVAAHQNRQAGTSTIDIGNIDSTNAATIGQDPTGLYAGGSGSFISSFTFGIDDLGIWHRALTPLEAASIYEAGSVNALSFNYVPVSFTSKALPGQQLELNFNEGTLQSTTNLTQPWTDVTTTSPYITSTTNSTQMFFRVVF